MLRAADVWFGYEAAKPALKGVSLSIAADAIVGILGPNGSGKTTLLRLLAGTRRPQRGSVTLDGAPLERTPRAALARRLAVVPQETQLAFDYTVAEVAMMGRYAHLAAFAIEGPRDMAVVARSLEATGTLHLADRAFATLSGGEKQRVVIAAALAQIGENGEDGGNRPGVTNGGTEQRSAPETHRPIATNERTEQRSTPETNVSPFASAPPLLRCDARPVPSVPSVPSRYLLLDEPTASLDLAYQLEIAALLTQLHASRRAGIVISTHDIALAGTLCDTLVLLRGGEIAAAGPTDDVLTSANLRRVFGVEAEISRHASGQRVIVPLGRAGGGPAW